MQQVVFIMPEAFHKWIAFDLESTGLKFDRLFLFEKETG